jgi:hypothetical protein
MSNAYFTIAELHLARAHRQSPVDSAVTNFAQLSHNSGQVARAEVAPKAHKVMLAARSGQEQQNKRST